MAKQYYIITDGKRYFIADEYGNKAGAPVHRKHGFKNKTSAQVIKWRLEQGRKLYKEIAIQKQRFEKNELQHFKSI